MLQVSNMTPGRSENFDETVAVTGHIIVSRGILLSVSYEKASANVLDIEGRKTSGYMLRMFVVAITVAISVRLESFVGKMDALEIRVIDLNAPARN